MKNANKASHIEASVQDTPVTEQESNTFSEENLEQTLKLKQNFFLKASRRNVDSSGTLCADKTDYTTYSPLETCLLCHSAKGHRGTRRIKETQGIILNRT